MSGYEFTSAQAEIVTGEQMAQALGERIATDVTAAFGAAVPDAAGKRTVDLGEHRIAVLAALREVSPDDGGDDATGQQLTEQLIKTLS